MTITNLINNIKTGILNPITNLLFAVAFVVFLWGIINYVLGSQGDEKKLAQGRQAIYWGIIGLFIMTSAWGIVKLFCNFFGTC